MAHNHEIVGLNPATAIWVTDLPTFPPSGRLADPPFRLVLCVSRVEVLFRTGIPRTLVTVNWLCSPQREQSDPFIECPDRTGIHTDYVKLGLHPSRKAQSDPHLIDLSPGVLGKTFETASDAILLCVARRVTR